MEGPINVITVRCLIEDQRELRSKLDDVDAAIAALQSNPGTQRMVEVMTNVVDYWEKNPQEN